MPPITGIGLGDALALAAIVFSAGGAWFALRDIRDRLRRIEDAATGHDRRLLVLETRAGSAPAMRLVPPDPSPSK